MRQNRQEGELAESLCTLGDKRQKGRRRKDNTSKMVSECYFTLIFENSHLWYHTWRWHRFTLGAQVRGWGGWGTALSCDHHRGGSTCSASNLDLQLDPNPNSRGWLSRFPRLLLQIRDKQTISLRASISMVQLYICSTKFNYIFVPYLLPLIHLSVCSQTPVVSSM